LLLQRLFYYTTRNQSGSVLVERPKHYHFFTLLLYSTFNLFFTLFFKIIKKDLRAAALPRGKRDKQAEKEEELIRIARHFIGFSSRIEEPDPHPSQPSPCRRTKEGQKSVLRLSRTIMASWSTPRPLLPTGLRNAV